MKSNVHHHTGYTSKTQSDHKPHSRFRKSIENGLIRTAVSKFEKFAAGRHFLLSLYLAPYRSVLEKEIGLSGITNKDIVLNVGCGAVPFTAIHIARRTGAQVIAIDNDPQVIDKAADIISNYSLSGKISILHADGKNFSGIKFTKAVVALQVSPKQKVLKNLLSRSQAGTCLLFRQPRKCFNRHYDLVKEDGHVSLVKHNMPTFNKTFLFIKQPSSIQGYAQNFSGKKSKWRNGEKHLATSYH